MMVYGKEWNKIAQKLNSRTPQMIKNRFYSYTRKEKNFDELAKCLKTLEGSYSNCVENIPTVTLEKLRVLSEHDKKQEE
jgi:hypothetical protein